MKKVSVFLCGLVLLFGFATSASALPVMYGDLATWQAGVGTYDELTSYGSDGSSISSIADVGYGESLAFSSPMTVYTVGSGWATWSGGYTGQVLYGGQTSITGTFGDGGLLGGFGFFAEPNPFSVWDMTLTLADGSTLTQSVDGYAGAAFFGWITDVAVTSFTISSGVDFAIGDIFSAASSNPVPEPATMLLLGVGLLGLAVGSRKRLGKK